MSAINILSPHIADLIAAGEVVERPASVVKELFENSVDAGAKNITIELRGGGMTYIRVTDDGGGMSPEDAGIAFLRHATSKLKTERDLEAIGTMGFRGEALAAIAAVSRIELLTRERGVSEGTRMLLEAGDIEEMTPAGCPEGATMIVRDLFFNTPARQKFMKSDRAEGSAAVTVARRCAMGRPDVSVRLIKDEKEEFFTPGDGRLDSCIYSLLGREFAASMLECAAQDDSVRVRGYISSPVAGRGNRAYQYFFCNGRPIRSATLQAALEQGYKNTLLTGRFPSCVLYIDLSFASVDVNVHPAKTEVRFSDERRVFDGIYYAVLSALGGESKTAEITISPKTNAAIQPKGDFFRSMTAGEFRKSMSGARSAQASAGAAPSVPAPAPGGNLQLREYTMAYQTSMDLASPRGAQYTQTAPAADRPPNREYAPVYKPAGQPAVIEEKTDPAADFRMVGEALGTYIIAEHGEELTLIDKHAAHERIIFDRLKAQGRKVMAQSLLVPVTWSPGGETAELMLKNAETLAGCGFELELYGDTSLVLRTLPADTDAQDAVAMLEELAEKLRVSGADEESFLDEILHTVACKAAIKAGRLSEPEELEAIVGRVLSGEIKYCPHGRPVAVILTKKELDRQFRRI